MVDQNRVISHTRKEHSLHGENERRTSEAIVHKQVIQVGVISCSPLYGLLLI